MSNPLTKDFAGAGKAMARKMRDRLGEVDSYRTAMRTMPDGSTIMLRTKGGQPQLTLEKEAPRKREKEKRKVLMVVGTSFSFFTEVDPAVNGPFLFDSAATVWSDGIPAALPTPTELSGTYFPVSTVGLCISEDGARVLGYTVWHTPCGELHYGTLWVNSVPMVLTGGVPNISNSISTFMSRSGTTLVFNGGEILAYSAVGSEYLQIALEKPNNFFSSFAYGVSDDGSTIYGIVTRTGGGCGRYDTNAVWVNGRIWIDTAIRQDVGLSSNLRVSSFDGAVLGDGYGWYCIRNVYGGYDWHNLSVLPIMSLSGDSAAITIWQGGGHADIYLGGVKVQQVTFDILNESLWPISYTGNVIALGSKIFVASEEGYQGYQVVFDGDAVVAGMTPNGNRIVYTLCTPHMANNPVVSFGRLAFPPGSNYRVAVADPLASITQYLDPLPGYMNSVCAHKGLNSIAPSNSVATIVEVER